MSKVEKSDSWASWLERLQNFVVGSKIFSGGILMVFASSFITPITSILGLPLTVILFTGTGAAIFLIVSLLWKEFSDNREVKKKERMSDIKLNCERAKEVDGILIRATTNSNPVERIKLYNQAIVLIRDFSEIKKQRTIEIAKTICGEKVTQEQQSIIFTLLEKYEPFRDKINKLLATKGLEAIKNNQLSKQSVEFLSSITDKDLELLKKQFKYVLQLPHQNSRSGLSSKDLAIWYFKSNDLEIQDILLEENGLMHLESYHIKFYGDIWIGEGVRGSSHTPQSQQGIIIDIDANGLNAIQFGAKDLKPQKGELVNLNVVQKTAIIFSAYVCLSGIGTEVFNLLKDELDPVPNKYLNELIVYWSKENPQFDLKLISKPKLITNDNP